MITKITILTKIKRQVAAEGDTGQASFTMPLSRFEKESPLPATGYFSVREKLAIFLILNWHSKSLITSFQ